MKEYDMSKGRKNDFERVEGGEIISLRIRSKEKKWRKK